MKTIAFATLMILACASALPQTSEVEQRRDVVEVVLDFIERYRQKIQEDGYDPLVIEKFERGFNAPGIINAYVFVENFKFTGLSDVVVNDIGHSLISNKFTFDASLPEIRVTLGGAGAGLSLLGRPVNQAFISGRFAIVGVRLVGELNVEVDADSKVTVSNLVVDTSLGGIESDVHLNVIGYDLSGYVNNILGHILPTVLSNNVNLINRAVERVVMFLLNLLL